MEFIGEYLKRERERQKLSIEEAVKSTRIKDCFIRAIEDERFESLPSPFYVKSFLRLYAEFLGLNPDEILNRFQRDHKEFAIKTLKVPQFLFPWKRKIRPSTFLLLVFGIALAVAMVYVISSVFPKQAPSFMSLRPAITISPVQVWTAQEETKNVPLPLWDQERFMLIKSKDYFKED